MNPWSSRRKLVIFGVVALALIVIVGLPAYFVSRDVPDCMNKKMDGDETGVDCGGSCELLCMPEVLPLIARGDARLLKIAPSTYEAVILIENPNVNGQVVRAPYTFKIYSGGEREPVQTFEGDTFIGRNSIFAVFRGPFELTGSGPFRAVFEWGQDLEWEKTDEPKPFIAVENMNLIIASSSLPRLEAKLVNRGQMGESNVEVIALLTDVNGNVQAAGKTFVDSLGAGASEPISFSWSEAFGFEPVSIRIIPHALPDKSYLR